MAPREERLATYPSVHGCYVRLVQVNPQGLGMPMAVTEPTEDGVPLPLNLTPTPCRPTSLSGVRDHSVQIQQVARLERLFRPFERGLELPPDEISDFPVNAVSHAALERLFGFIPVDIHAQRNGLFHLQTGPRRTDIFQDRRSLPLAARTFLPANLYHVRAQHTNFRSPLAHTSHIGGCDRGLYTVAAAFGLERVLFSISWPHDIIED